MNALDELRDFPSVLLVVDIPPPRLRNEDGSPMIIASDEDVLYEAWEFLAMQGVKITPDPKQTYEAIVVARTKGWEKSPEVAVTIQRAKESQVSLFFCDPQSRRVIRW